tara:strand:- start:289 stop:1545 length:1257 start_codon:yes stop_codon:yes gene_type:complete
MAELRQNTWSLNQWYDQDVAGNAKYEASGKLWMWGYNYYGQLGQNEGPGSSVGSYSSPIQVGTDTTWTRVATYGNNNVFAMKQDGSVWSWGSNGYGQLGLNDANHRSSPTQIPGTGWQMTRDSFFGSVRVTQAIKTDGTQWIWGTMQDGELGLGTRVTPTWTLASKSSPTQLPGSWSKVQNSSGLKTDGSLWMWGRNFYGELGQNKSQTSSPIAMEAASSPCQIPGTWKDFSRSDELNSYCSGIKTNGTLWCWGKNNYGQSGDGTPGQPSYHPAWRISSPTQIGTDADWERCAAATQEGKNVWQKTDGSIWFSGPGPTASTYGVGTRSSPTQIPGTVIPGIDYILIGQATFSMDSPTAKVYFNGPNYYGLTGKNQSGPVTYSSLTYLPDVWDKFKNTGITKNQLGVQASGSVAAIEKQ